MKLTATLLFGISAKFTLEKVAKISHELISKENAMDAIKKLRQCKNKKRAIKSKKCSNWKKSFFI